MVVQVDQDARPFRERLELDVQIDDNLILHAQARSLNKKDLAGAKVHNLEFGLALPAAAPTPFDHDEVELRESVAVHDKGSVVLRSNVADRINQKLVPGELLLSYDSRYFDRRNDPPQIQASERNYYKQCDGCGRDSNDPLCHRDPTRRHKRERLSV